MVKVVTAGMSEEDGDFCVGVCLQVFLTTILVTCTICIYGTIIPIKYSYSSVSGMLHAMLFGVLITLMVASYLKTWLSDPGTVTRDWSPPKEIASELEEEGGVKSSQSQFCKRCKIQRPPRSAHCRQCGKCVLRMDHHCPWVQNCVGAANHKFFFLFLFYGTITSLYYSIMTFIFLAHVLEQHLMLQQLGTWMGVVLGMLILVLVLSMMQGGLCIWNGFLILKNQTATENYELDSIASKNRNSKKKVKVTHKYDVGWYRNTQSVMGDNPAYWLLPLGIVRTDGLSMGDLGRDAVELQPLKEVEGTEQSSSPFAPLSPRTADAHVA
uniref:Palmitoyltransferase n=1 Tax=Guillardia theta TaxID=55529 RepID=A0A7S4NRR7_GUITH